MVCVIKDRLGPVLGPVLVLVLGLVLGLGAALLLVTGCDPDDDGDPPDGTPLIGLVSVEVDPDKVLSCIVTWRTDVPTTPAVEYGLGGELTHVVRGEGADGAFEHDW